MSDKYKEIIKQEYRKCFQDPIYFMKKYCVIQHPQKGKINFNLYSYQEDCLRDFNTYDYNIILKSRQLGISTLCAAYSLWYMTFYGDKNIMVLATKQEVAKNLVTKVRVMYQNLPSWIKVPSVEDNKLSLRFKNGSQIKATTTNSDAGRSESLSMLVVDEAAFIDNIDIVWSAAQQTLATGGKAILLSSPNGTGNFFHKTWEDAENNPKSRFHHIRLPWTVHPERDQAWRDKQDELLGPRMASQECDADFISSGNTLLEPDLLSWYENTTVQEPVEKRGFDGNLWIWEYPNYSRQYVVSADVARGDGGDYSAFHIIDVETLTQVAEYKGQIGTKEFGHMLMSVATEYNKALLVVENANVGWAALQPIIESGYENLFYAANDLSIMDIQAQIAKGYDLKDKYNMKPGFSTTSRTRPLLISKLDTVARERCIIIRSKRLMSELRVFIWKGDRAEAQSGYNDDLVMSFCIGLWVRDTAFKLIQQGLDLTKRALGHIHKSGETSIYSPGIVRQTGWSMSNGKGSEESLTWLI
jgi:hypothetical protein